MADERVRHSTEDPARRLEDAWKSGGDTDLDRYLPSASSPQRIPLLVRLVKVDQQHRWQAGEQNLLEQYLQRWPELRDNAGAISELLQSECEIRSALGDNPTQEELQQRFPTLFEHVDLNTVAVDSKAGEAAAPNPAGTPVSRDSHPTPQPSWCVSMVGSRVGRYEIRSLLGAGGMGEVYRAFDTELQREVALKIPRVFPDTRPEVLSRFVQEALAAASLRHPHICPVYDAGQIEDRYYIVMALIEGTTLSEKLKEGECDLEFAVRVVAQLARALDAAHEAGIIHRDIKPANVLIDKSAQPLLTDCGLARRSNADEQLSVAGTLLGTPAYMSPEQAEMRPVDRRADIYSLGVVLFQMLTGTLPFTGPPAQLLLQIVKGKPLQPSKVRKDLPAQLETICLTAMARDREQRFQTAAELAESLESLARPATAGPVHRHQRLVAGLIAVLVLIGAVIPLAYWNLIAGRHGEQRSGQEGGRPEKPLTERDRQLAALEQQLALLAPAGLDIEHVRQLEDQYRKVKASVFGVNAQSLSRDIAMALTKLKSVSLSERETSVATELDQYLAQDNYFRTPEDAYLMLRALAEMIDVRFGKLQSSLEEMRSSSEVTPTLPAAESQSEADSNAAEVARRSAETQHQLDGLQGAMAEISALREIESAFREVEGAMFKLEQCAGIAVASYVHVGRLGACELTEDETADFHDTLQAAFRLGIFGRFEDVYKPARVFAERVGGRVALLRQKLTGLQSWSPDTTHYFSLIEMRPSAVQALCDEARLRGGPGGSWPDAIAVASQAIATSPEDATLYALRATLHAENHDYAPAMSDLETSLKYNKQLGYAYYVRGYVHTAGGQYVLAVGDCDKALQLDPRLVQAYRTRADAYNHVAAFLRAEEDATDAIRMNSQFADAYRVRAEARIGLEKWQEALEDSQVAIEYEPNGPNGYFTRARVLHHLEEYQQAIDNLTRAVLLDSSNSQFYRLRAECREKVGDALRAAGDRKRAENMEQDAQSPPAPVEPPKMENTPAAIDGSE